MKNNERTYFDITKRFLAPILKTPFIFIRSFVIFSFWTIEYIITVLFLERIVYFLETENSVGFKNTLICFIIYFVLSNIFHISTSKIGWSEIKPQFIINMQREYLQKFTRLNNNRIETIGVGKMIAIINDGISTWGQLIFNLIFTGSAIFISVMFTLYMLGKESIKFTIIFILFFVFSHIIGFFINKKILKIRKKRIEHKNLGVKQLVKILMSKFEILQSNKISKEVDILDFHQKKQIYYNKRLALPLELFFKIPDIGVTLMILFTFFYYGNQILLGESSLSTLVGLSGALILMQKTISISVEFYKDITREFSEVEVMWDFFDNTKEIKGYNKGKDFKYKKGNININNLVYSYGKGKKIFDDFNLKIKGEKILALVGNSGGGKSTLAKLISGYIRANKGDIVIDNQKLNDTSLKTYYKEIGYLTQEPSVFDGTVLDNLTYAIENNIKEMEIKKFIKYAKCEFIYDLPKGILTEIGERGVKLSGGQKQRLAIAKIFLKDPKIIILDEPTSALDSFSEEQITKAMHNLFRGRTVIIIAHRLQTVKNADRIVVIENGKIIEDGTHKTLVKNKGHYAKMLKLQSGF